LDANAAGAAGWRRPAGGAASAHRQAARPPAVPLSSRRCLRGAGSRGTSGEAPNDPQRHQGRRLPACERCTAVDHTRDGGVDDSCSRPNARRWRAPQVQAKTGFAAGLFQDQELDPHVIQVKRRPPSRRGGLPASRPSTCGCMPCCTRASCLVRNPNHVHHNWSSQDKESKVAYLNKLVAVVSLVLREEVPARPLKVRPLFVRDAIKHALVHAILPSSVAC
jgi:hypothetical protein